MKKLFIAVLCLPLLSCFFIASAQSERPEPFLSVGPEFSWDAQTAYRAGLGLSVKYGLPITGRSTITLTSGYTLFRGMMQKTSTGGEGRNLHMGLLPLRLGFRFDVFNGIYVEPQLGYSKIMFEGKDEDAYSDFNALNYGVNVGIVKGEHLDFSAFYQGLKHETRRFSSLYYPRAFHAAGVRIAYRLDLNR